MNSKSDLLGNNFEEPLVQNSNRRAAVHDLIAIMADISRKDRGLDGIRTGTRREVVLLAQGCDARLPAALVEPDVSTKRVLDHRISIAAAVKALAKRTEVTFGLCIA